MSDFTYKKKSLRPGLWLLVSIFLLFAKAWGAETPQVSQEFLESLTTELTEDITYYRWQSKASGENLARLGTLNEKTNQYFMGMTQNIAAGPGVYMADDAGSSSSYLPKKSEGGGNLLEVRIPKGTRFINLYDPKISAIFKKMKIDPEAVLMQKSSFGNKPLVIQYSSGWFVGRDLTGIAQFELFPSKHQTPDSVRLQYNKLLRDPPAAQQFIDQLKESDRGLVSAVMKDNNIYDSLTQALMTDEQKKSALTVELNKAQNAEDVTKLAKLMVNCVECRHLMTDDSELAPLAKTKIIKYADASAMDVIVSTVPQDWTLDYFRTAGVDSKQSRYLLRTYVRDVFRNNLSSKAAVSEMMPVLKEFARQGGGEEWREDFAEILHRRTEIARENGENPASIKAVLDEFGSKNGEKAQAARAVLNRAEVFYGSLKGLQGRAITPDQVRAAIKSAESPGEVRRVVDAIVNGDSGSQGTKVLKEVLLSEPSLYIRGGKDWSVAKVAAIFETYKGATGIEPSEIYYSYLKSLPADVRANEIADAYGNLSHVKWETRDEVRGMIMSRLDELIKGVDDLSPLAEGFFKVEVGSKREQTQKLSLVKAVKTPEQLKSITPWISKVDPDSKTSFVTADLTREVHRKAGEIGFSRFTPDQTLRLIDAKDLKAVDQHRYYTQLIDNALTPNDLIQIYYDMDRNSTLAKSDLSLYVVRRMQMLKPTQSEIDTLKRMNPRLIGINKITPLTEFECVSNLSRALSTVRSRNK